MQKNWGTAEWWEWRNIKTYLHRILDTMIELVTVTGRTTAPTKWNIRFSPVKKQEASFESGAFIWNTDLHVLHTSNPIGIRVSFKPYMVCCIPMSIEHHRNLNWLKESYEAKSLACSFVVPKIAYRVARSLIGTPLVPICVTLPPVTRKKIRVKAFWQYQLVGETTWSKDTYVAVVPWFLILRYLVPIKKSWDGYPHMFNRTVFIRSYVCDSWYAEEICIGIHLTRER